MSTSTLRLASSVGVPPDVAAAITLADRWIKPPDLRALDHATLIEQRVALEHDRRVLTEWVRSRRRDGRAYGRFTDPSILERVERAGLNLANGISVIHAENARRKGERRDDYEREELAKAAELRAAASTRSQPSAEEVARKLAAEVERLNAELAAAGDSRFHQAFYEAARIVLAEGTVTRIAERARQLMRTGARP